jgi:hypothetical protein
VDQDTQLNESQVDAFVDNNGYALESSLATVATTGSYGSLTGTPNYSAGAGLNLASETFSADFGGNGSASKVSRSDHNHPTYTARKQVDDTVETTYEVSLERYHLSTSYSSSYMATKPIPQDVMEDYCGDEDGCEVVIAMRNWTSANTSGMVASYKLHFFYDVATLRWRADDYSAGTQGRDNNGSGNHVINAWGACYFTDSVYIGGASQGDNEKGMHLLYWTEYLNSNNKRCEITISD